MCTDTWKTHENVLAFKFIDNILPYFCVGFFLLVSIRVQFKNWTGRWPMVVSGKIIVVCFTGMINQPFDENCWCIIVAHNVSHQNHTCAQAKSECDLNNLWALNRCRTEYFWIRVVYLVFFSPVHFDGCADAWFRRS